MEVKFISFFLSQHVLDLRKEQLGTAMMEWDGSLLDGDASTRKCLWKDFIG
jgi:hypothetical protein